MTNEHDQGDYVLVHKTRAKISRARKGVIGLMAVGAIAALAGTGTFASFSAETANEAAFDTGRLIMLNRVTDSNDVTGAECASSDTNDLTNNTEDCDTLFTSLSPGYALLRKTVEIENESDSAQALQMYVEGACAAADSDFPGGALACDEAQIIIREANADTLAPLAATCVFPAADPLCNSVGTEHLEWPDLDAFAGAASLNDLQTWAGNAWNVAGSDALGTLPFDDDGDNNAATDTDEPDNGAAADDEKAYVFYFRLPYASACDAILLDDPDDDGDADGTLDDSAGVLGDGWIGDPIDRVAAAPPTLDDDGFDVNGVGCNNALMNAAVDLMVRWRFQDTTI